VDSFQSEDWRPRVAAFLAGRDFVTLAEVAREAIDRPFATMTGADWRSLASIMTACGFRNYKHNGVRYWAPEPATPGETPRLRARGLVAGVRRPEPSEPIAQLQLI
jgi:hypothetical protein